MKLSINMAHILRFFDFATSVEMMKTAGFEAMDYPVSKFFVNVDQYDMNEYRAIAQNIRAICDQNEMPITQTHSRFTYPLEQWQDPVSFEKVIFTHLIHSLELSGIFGADVCVIHPIHYMTYRGHEEEIFEQNMKFYRRLIPYAAEYDVKIGVENMFQRDPLRNYIVDDTCSTPDEFVRYIDTLNSEWITACLDVGHAGLPCSAHTATDMIHALGHDRLGALHIHDNDYTNDQHNLPYLGKLNWAEIAKALGEIDYKGDFTYEVNGLLIADRDEGFLPIGLKFMADVGHHLVRMIDDARPVKK